MCGLSMCEVKKWIACWAIAVGLLNSVGEIIRGLAALGLQEDWRGVRKERLTKSSVDEYKD